MKVPRRETEPGSANTGEYGSKQKTLWATGLAGIGPFSEITSISWVSWWLG